MPDIDEIKNNREELERDLLERIRDFETENDVVLDYLMFERANSDEFTGPLEKVTVNISIPSLN